MGHPSSCDGMDPRHEGLTVLHLGPVGAGKQIATDDQLRQEFAYKVKGLFFLFQVTTNLIRAVHDSQKYSLILYLINNVEDIALLFIIFVRAF